jgi:hypothetical protein
MLLRVRLHFRPGTAVGAVGKAGDLGVRFTEQGEPDFNAGPRLSMPEPSAGPARRRSASAPGGPE